MAVLWTKQRQSGQQVPGLAKTNTPTLPVSSQGLGVSLGLCRARLSGRNPVDCTSRESRQVQTCPCLCAGRPHSALLMPALEHCHLLLISLPLSSWGDRCFPSRKERISGPAGANCTCVLLFTRPCSLSEAI